MTVPPPSPTAADRDFATWCRTRDPEALGRVFDATAGKLLLVAMHLLRDAAAAEDALQATFLAAMRSAAHYDPARPVLPWLTGILARQAALARRERARVPDPARVAVGAPAPDPAEVAAASESAAAIARALDDLPGPYRPVLVLALVHGLRGIEIARALERPPETVRSQLHRGLELLR
jgi:RNA polymerase sigma-70 factor (ECF subfamily)